MAEVVHYDSECKRKGGPAEYCRALLDGIENLNPNAMYIFVLMARQAEGYEANANRNFRLIQKAAEQEHIPSQLLLAEFYIKGIGCDPSSEKATRWLKEAAKLGSSEAKKQLNKMDSSIQKTSANITNNTKKASPAPSRRRLSDSLESWTEQTLATTSLSEESKTVLINSAMDTANNIQHFQGGDRDAIYKKALRKKMELLGILPN
jgi:TPR repeat protein